MDDQIIRSYEEWKTCIASAYGRMTIAFIDERIGALEDTTNECSQKVHRHIWAGPSPEGDRVAETGKKSDGKQTLISIIRPLQIKPMRGSG